MTDREWKKLTRHMELIKKNLFTLNDSRLPQTTRDMMIQRIKDREVKRSKLIQKKS